MQVGFTLNELDVDLAVKGLSSVTDLGHVLKILLR